MKTAAVVPLFQAQSLGFSASAGGEGFSVGGVLVKSRLATDLFPSTSVSPGAGWDFRSALPHSGGLIIKQAESSPAEFLLTDV